MSGLVRFISSPISHFFNPESYKSHSRMIQQAQHLAAKTPQILDQFSQYGLFFRYCGPFAAYNFLQWNQRKVKIDSLLKHFNIHEVNLKGCNVVSFKKALSAHGIQKPQCSLSLSNRQIEQILANRSPIAALIKKTSKENHWLTLIGSDDRHYYAIDYDVIRTFEKKSFSRSCRCFLYDANDVCKK